jgi:hypothetical protein
MTRRLSVGFCGLLLAGCLSTGNSKLSDESILSQIKVGQTSKEQVGALLGEPSEKRVPLAGGRAPEWWSYRYSDSTVNPLEYVFLYGFLINGIGTPDTRHVLDVFYGSDGVVTTLAHMKTDYDMGGPFSPIKVTSTNVIEIALGQTKAVTRFEDKMDRPIPVNPERISAPRK